jgi:excisionase family DNA binding protein
VHTVLDHPDALATETETERRTRTVPESAAMLGISVTTAWKMVYGGQMRAVRFGRAVRVPVEEIERLLRGAQRAHDQYTIPPGGSEKESPVKSIISTILSRRRIKPRRRRGFQGRGAALIGGAI